MNLFLFYITDQKHNFERRETNNLGTPYDFSSVMQYSNRAFSKNGERTLRSWDDWDQEFGSADSMSDYDILRVNRLYNC
ncbi:hypothetical protein WMY93_032691 [Mugilogobius chulae]|uniref:Metalloendopeptidase n=1 Tax=Mugilogobius chulae TaxID=88201 RepID=A0AAW0MJ39_9GOBI